MNYSWLWLAIIWSCKTWKGISRWLPCIGVKCDIVQYSAVQHLSGRDMGCCGGQCGMWQLLHWDRWCSVGVPAPAKFLAMALWQQFCGSRLWGQWRGLGGTTGGIKCDPEVNLQMIPWGRDLFSIPAYTNWRGPVAVTSIGGLECFGYFKIIKSKMDGVFWRGLRI